MARTNVVTGAASGIGRATKELLEQRGETVIGVDLAGSDIDADLTTPEGRATLVSEVEKRSGGTVDAVFAIAGLALPVPATVGVNYFGMIATLEGLRPLLATSDAPRAVGISSMASLFPVDDELVARLDAGDEPGALARAAAMTEEEAANIYASTKRAFARWIRRHAATSDWAGASIPLNAIAPGIIRTPMTADLTSTPEGVEQILQMVPMPLNGVAEPIATAYLLAWLCSVENSHLCGQVVFVDGGSDAVIRGDSTW